MSKNKNMMKKLLLAIIGLAFAFAISSCNEKHVKGKIVRSDSPASEEKQERHHRRW